MPSILIQLPSVAMLHTNVNIDFLCIIFPERLVGITRCARALILSTLP